MYKFPNSIFTTFLFIQASHWEEIFIYLFIYNCWKDVYLQLYLVSWPTTRSFSSTKIHLQYKEYCEKTWIRLTLFKKKKDLCTEWWLLLNKAQTNKIKEFVGCVRTWSILIYYANSFVIFIKLNQYTDKSIQIIYVHLSSNV